MQRIIGIYSPAPQSGKTFVATVLTHSGYIRLSFAAPIKQMCIDFLLSMGYSKNDAMKYVFAEKETMIPEAGKTVRQLMQLLGTEWGRNCVNENIWITAFKKNAAKYEKVIVDDVRFVNEAKTIQSLGGEMWKVVRPSSSHDSSHVSEGGLDNYIFDQVIQNDGTLMEFRKKIDKLI